MKNQKQQIPAEENEDTTNISQIDIQKDRLEQPKQPKRKTNKKHILLLATILAATVTWFGVNYFSSNQSESPQKTNQLESPQINSADYVSQTVTSDEVRIAKSESQDSINNRLAALENHFESIARDDSTWNYGEYESDSPNYHTLSQSWCKIVKNSSREPVRCHGRAQATTASGYSQTINIEKSGSGAASIGLSSKNITSGGVSFSYFENSQKDENRFSLFFQDQSIPKVVTSRLNVKVAGTGSLTKNVISLGPLKNTLLEDLRVYLKSTKSLKIYSIQKLEKLRSKAKIEINSDNIRKYTNCRTGTDNFSDFISECKVSNLTAGEKQQYISNINQDIDSQISQLKEMDLDRIYEILKELTFYNECPSCWKN